MSPDSAMDVLVAMSDRWESSLVTALDRSPGVTVVRRCADLADLLAAAAVGLAPLALVSADLRLLDRSCLDQLRVHGVAVVGVHGPGDDEARERLRRLGIGVVISADLPSAQIAASLEEATLAAAPDGAAASEGTTVASAATTTAALDLTTLGQWPQGVPLGTECDADDGPGARGTIVAVWGPTGSPGRTTIAVNLAAELAQLGATTVLVDADTYGGSIAQVLSLLDEAPGIAAATRAAEHGTLDLDMLARLSPEVAPRLRVLTGIPKAERWTELRSAPLEQVLSLTRRLARWTVVDCGFSLEDDEELSYDTLTPRRNAATLTALQEADRLLAVGAGDPIGLQRLVRGLQELGTVRSPRPTVVINKVRASAVGRDPQRRIAEALARFAGVDDIRFVPADVATLDEVLLAGRSLAEAAPKSALRQAFTALAHELQASVEPAAARPVEASRGAGRERSLSVAGLGRLRPRRGT